MTVTVGQARSLATPPADTSDDDVIPQLWSELRQRYEQTGAH